MRITKKTSKNQVTIPREIAQKFPDAQYFEIFSRDREIILRPLRVEEPEERLYAIKDNMSRLGIDKRDIDDAIRWARKK